MSRSTNTVVHVTSQSTKIIILLIITSNRSNIMCLMSDSINIHKTRVEFFCSDSRSTAETVTEEVDLL